MNKTGYNLGLFIPWDTNPLQSTGSRLSSMMLGVCFDAVRSIADISGPRTYTYQTGHLLRVDIKKHLQIRPNGAVRKVWVGRRTPGNLKGQWSLINPMEIWVELVQAKGSASPQQITPSGITIHFRLRLTQTELRTKIYG